VIGDLRRLIRAAKADQVGRDRAQAGGGQDRDYLAVEEGPAGFAVQEQYWGWLWLTWFASRGRCARGMKDGEPGEVLL
jgi:hypothetical protein